jgi:hypothetical protein
VVGVRIRTGAVVGVLAAGILGRAVPVVAQTGKTRSWRNPTIELAVGGVGFVDDATIWRQLWGGALRIPLTPRISVGSEVSYFQGSDSENAFALTGNITFDLIGIGQPRAASFTPYLVGSAGLFRTVGLNTEGAFTAGGGIRVWLRDRIAIGGDYRIGWELHQRFAGTLSVRFGR